MGRHEVYADITTGTERNDKDRPQPCTYAKCGECGHLTMSWGTSRSSALRCLALLNEECPEGQNNFYLED